MSPAGPISPIDILWGHRLSLARGNYYMAHKVGFTAQSLTQALLEAGFAFPTCQVCKAFCDATLIIE